MIARTITETILKNLSVFPAANIIGQRQVGKTTLAKHLQTRLDKPSIYLDLQDEQDLDKLASPALFLREHSEKCVVIDEIQRLPTLYSQLRSLIDERRDPARFILLGSASPSIIKGVSESLAGRVFFSELMPFSLLEAEGLAAWQVHWVRGGFPNVLAMPMKIWWQNGLTVLPGPLWSANCVNWGITLPHRFSLAYCGCWPICTGNC